MVGVKYLRLRKTPYVAPVAVLAVVGVVALVPTLSGASSPAGLPAQSAEQLVADIAAAKAPQLSGALQWTVNLGFSGLSALEQETGQGSGDGGGGGASFDPLTLLSDNYQVNVWLDGSTAEHLALVDGPAQEVDLVRNGEQGWLWDSSTQTVTHFTWDGGQAQTPASSQQPPTWIPPTPDKLAAGLLRGLSKTTSVATGAPVYVAGEPAYQLIVAPKAAPGSTVDHIEIDVGASGALLGVPLQVAVYAQGQAARRSSWASPEHFTLGRLLRPSSASRRRPAQRWSPAPCWRPLVGWLQAAPAQRRRARCRTSTDDGKGWATVVSGFAPGS